MPVRGVRGAVVVPRDDPELVLSATRELLLAILESNPEMQSDDLASVVFTVTGDISSVYPAQAARQIGWEVVPLMCATEIPVPNGLTHCIRVLIHWNTDIHQSQIRHIYLGDAAVLRPDMQKTSER